MLGILFCYVSASKYITLRDKYHTALANYKALEYSSDSITTHSRVLQLSIEELEYSRDSITNELLETFKELGIKNKKIKSLSYVKSDAVKVDTLVFRDTIFVKDTHIDTLLTDNKWYSTRLELDYPSKIVVTPSFTSEKHIVVSSKRETIKPPSPIFFIRWFQKKHTVLEVNIVEKNPYINEEENKFIEIIK